MKHFDDSLNQQLKEVNNRIQLTNQEKQDILFNINENITFNETKSKNNHKLMAFALTVIALVLFIVLIPLMTSDTNQFSQDEGTQAILPDNYSQDELPFDLKLPSYLPFEPTTSKLQTFSQNTLIQDIDIVEVHYRNNDQSYLTIKISNREGKQEVVNSEKIITDKRYYQYSNNGTVQNLYFEDSGLKYTLTTDTIASKGELIKTAESIVPLVQLDIEITDQSTMLKRVEDNLEVGMSQNQVTNIIGESNTQFRHGTEQQMYDYWRYDFYAEGSNYKPKYNFVDFPAILEEGKLNSQLFIKWENGAVHSFSTVFKDPEDGRIKHWLMNEKSKGINKRYFPKNESEKQFRSMSYPYVIPQEQEVLKAYKTHSSRQTKSSSNTTLDTYLPGDDLIIEDVVKSVEYNKKENFSTIYVEAETPESKFNYNWEFRGDLTQKYQKGDTLKVKMKVIAASPEGIYKQTNYMPLLGQMNAKSIPPDPNDFIID